MGSYRRPALLSALLERKHWVKPASCLVVLFADRDFPYRSYIQKLKLHTPEEDNGD